MGSLGRYLVVAGLLLAAVGGMLIVGQRLGLGRLPLDFEWKRRGVTVYFPLASSIVVSVVLTVLLNLWLGRK